MFKNFNKTGRAFTLIELLLVVAVIGILASVVLVQYPGAFKKVKDSRVFSAMAQLRTQSLLLYENQKTYSGLSCVIVGKRCSCSDETVEVLCNEVGLNSDQDLIIRLNDNDKGYCTVAHLSGAEKYFCIDSAFHATTFDAIPANCGSGCESAGDGGNCSCE